MDTVFLNINAVVVKLNHMERIEEEHVCEFVIIFQTCEALDSPVSIIILVYAL
jgi:hypothetical protein